MCGNVQRGRAYHSLKRLVALFLGRLLGAGGVAFFPFWRHASGVADGAEELGGVGGGRVGPTAWARVQERKKCDDSGKRRHRNMRQTPKTQG